jgi:hypothetical protein
MQYRAVLYSHVLVFSVVALRRSALRNFAHNNVYNESQTFCQACHPNSNKIERVPTKRQAKDATLPVSETNETDVSVRLTHSFGVLSCQNILLLSKTIL